MKNEHFLDQLGMQNDRLTLMRVCLKDASGMTVSSRRCLHGCPPTKWVVGEETIEPHSVTNKSLGVFAEPIAYQAEKTNFLFPMFHAGSFSVALLVEARREHITYISEYDALEIAATRLKVLDLMERSDPRAQFLKQIWINTRQISQERFQWFGGFAKSWDDLAQVLR